MKDNRPWFVAVKKQVRLAMIYTDDGALVTGAKLLRDAADLIDLEHERRRELITEALNP